MLDTHTPVLTEDENLFIDNGGQMNFLIEGDNLASLQLLEKTHKGKIDLIYIDPPYNTGKKTLDTMTLLSNKKMLLDIANGFRLFTSVLFLQENFCPKKVLSLFLLMTMSFLL